MPLSIAGLIGFAVVPFAFLLGLVRTRYTAAGAVGELIERLNTPDRRMSLREALANALGDRSLQLVYWREWAGHYVTYDGQRYELPEPGAGRAVAEVERDGKLVGAIVYDAALRDDPSLVRAAAAAAALAARERAPRGRAASPRRGAPELARAARRRLDVRAPPARARPARRRPAAARRALAAARPRPAQARARPADRRAAARGGPRRAVARPGGAARAGPRHPSRRPHRARPRGGARGARRPRAGCR